MMIDVLIPAAGFERIRDRIMEILVLEFNNQVVNFYNTDCEGVKFFAERLTPMDKTETAFINLSLFKGEFSNKDVEYVDGTYAFVFDIVTNAKNTSDSPADKISNLRLQKLIGILRYILEHPNYDKLLFTAPFILHTMFTKFQPYKAEGGSDTLNTAMAQAMFMVRCGEVTTPNDGNYVEESETVVKVELTENGYEYQIVYE